jgi:hypothetical protein
MKASSQLIDGFNERLMESMRRETRPFLDHSHGGTLDEPRSRLKTYDVAVSGSRIGARLCAQHQPQHFCQR